MFTHLFDHGTCLTKKKWGLRSEVRQVSWLRAQLTGDDFMNVFILFYRQTTICYNEQCICISVALVITIFFNYRMLFRMFLLILV